MGIIDAKENFQKRRDNVLKSRLFELKKKSSEVLSMTNDLLTGLEKFNSDLENVSIFANQSAKTTRKQYETICEQIELIKMMYPAAFS